MAMDKRAFMAVIVISSFLFSLFTRVHMGVAQQATMLPSIANPAIPEFAVKFEANPYDVSPIYGIDRYTGKNVTVEGCYHVENESIVVTIKNQRSPGYFYGTNYYLSFGIRVKGHFEDYWTSSYSIDQSTSEYTVFSKPIEPNDYPPGAQIDFQAQTNVVHNYQFFVDAVPPWTLEGHFETRIATDGTSGWSNTQTITLPEPSPAPTLAPTPTFSPNPTLYPSPTPNSTSGVQTENLTPTLAIIGLAIGVSIILGLLAYLAKFRGWK